MFLFLLHFDNLHLSQNLYMSSELSVFIDIKLFMRIPYSFLIPVELLAVFLLSFTMILVRFAFPLTLISPGRALFNGLIFSKDKLLVAII